MPARTIKHSPHPPSASDTPGPDHAANLAGLSPRERQVAAALYEGLSLRQIAQGSASSIETLRKQRASVYRKLGVNSLAGLRQVWAPQPSVFTRPSPH
ncbi:LuxR C-terminal-related transcriptional regulator [Amantichitinum ursilacus]|uniref:DNA-binding transcriptional activator BglJ n=1 Tax=Amantichitinum ursilacus TaxID=857265 RepID=A0A0N0GNH6_9NEIS|nr:helix-turn-helix transcriptional regulator [Amantichitinum ursilacus]KPC52583.1 DNA-binding transcriptional activator BglJ [Amantichitinum ursilacus]